jgi:NADP-dependent 3-hydroxy acid dehydrogenase YdfG
VARHEETVRAAAEELSAGGRKTIAVRCDVIDDIQVASRINRTVSTFERLDAAFNNAGIISAHIEPAGLSGE